MNRKSLSMSLMRQLHDDVECHYIGSLKATITALEDIPETFFRSLEDRAQTRRLGQLDEVLAYNDMDPGNFLRHTWDFQFGPLARLMDDAEVLRERRPKQKRHWLMQEARRLSRVPGDEGLDVESLDRLREDDPVAAAKTASRALRRSAGARAAAEGLGCWASAQRICYRLDLAVMAIAEAMQIAARARHQEIVADLVERSVYITMDRGEYSWALQLARNAHHRYTDLGDLNAMGKTLTTMAVVLNRLGESRSALQTANAALQFLDSDSSQRYRASVHSIIGAAQASLNDLTAAAQAADVARRLAPGRIFRGRADWLQAFIAAKRKDFNQAEAHYRNALEALTEPADALLIGAELVRVLVRNGKADEAVAVAKTRLLRLSEPLCEDPLDENRLLAATHTQLLRAALETRLTLQLVNKVIDQIKKGRAQRSARLRERASTT